MLLGVLSAMICISAKAQTTVTITTAGSYPSGAPAVGNGVEYLGHMAGTSGYITGAPEKDNYVAHDNTACLGQTFTTGNDPSGYELNSISFEQVTNGGQYGGTYAQNLAGGSLGYRVFSLSGSTIGSVLATESSISITPIMTWEHPNPAGSGAWWVTITFASPITLAANTQYAFDLQPDSAGQFYMEWDGTNVSNFSGGQAFADDGSGGANGYTPNATSVTLLTGSRTFVANMTALGAPSVTAVANPASAPSGQSFTVTATVTPGAGTVTNVSVNLSSIGGVTAANLVDAGGNVWTNTFTVPGGAPLGMTSLPVTATDTTPLSGTYGLAFTVLPSAWVWDGGSAVDSQWSSANNWVGDVAVPLSGNNSITFAGTARLTPDMSANYSLAGLSFSNTAGSFVIGSSTGGTLTNGSGGIINNSANTQTLNVPLVLSAAQSFNAAAGNLILNSNVTGGAAVTLPGTNTVTLAGTGTSAIGDLFVTNGLLKVTAGTVTVSDTSGDNTKIDMGGSVEVDAGAVVTVTNGGTSWFPVNDNSGTTSSLTVNGGTLNIFDEYGIEVPRQGNAVLTINGGSMTVNDSGGVGLIIGDQAAAGTGTVNLNGGTLTVNKISANNGTGKFYFNGGTLKPAGSNAGFFPTTGTLSSYVRNGGAIIDTASLNVSAWPFLNHSDIGTDNALDGGLTKIGNGSLMLSSGYGYTGPNIVLGGTLKLTSWQSLPSSGGDLVVSNASLLFDASSGLAMPAANVMLDNGAVVTLTNNPYANAVSGTGNLLVQTNTTLNLNYGSLGGSNPGSAAINVTGSMSVTGANNVINILGTGFTVGQFPLIKYNAGTLSDISGFKIGTLPAGVTASLVNNTGSQSLDLNIVSIGQNLTWYGADSSGNILTNWDINSSADWNYGGATYQEYNGNTFGDLVTFDDNLYNNGINPPATNVNLTTALHPSQITMNNNSYPYVFSGPGTLAGPTTLTLDGTGSLTLQTSNSFTGGVVLNSGTLVITNDNELGANTGVVTLNGGTLQAAGNITSIRPVSLMTTSTVDVVSGMTAQLAGPMTGTGDLILTNQGTLTLAPAGTNSIGNLRLSSGQLNITAGTVTVTDASGSSTRIENNATLTVSGGTLNIVDGGNGWFPIGVTAGSTGTVVVAGGTINVLDHWGTEAGNESGAGVLTINSGTFLNNDIGKVGLLFGEAGSAGGTVNLNGGVLAVNKIISNVGGSFYLNGGTLSPVLNNGASFFASSATLSAQVRNGGVIVNVGAGTNVTIGQSLIHSTVVGDSTTDGGLTKNGSGTLNLSGTNSYTGNTTVNAGILELSQSIPTLNTNSAVLIASGAVLQLDNAAVTNMVASLMTNGVAAGNGLYSSANSSGFITGSGYLQVGAVVGPTGPASITNTISGNTLTLAWPAGQGWRLQMQTNSLSKGLGTNWVYVTDGSVSSTNITVEAAKPTVFYRLKYP